MTVIVWDGTTLAADRAASDGAAQWETEKIWRWNGEFIAGAGPLQTILQMKEWYKRGAHRKYDEFPSAQLANTTWCHFIVVDSNDGLTRWEQGMIPIQHGRTPCAFGEGKDFAYGAMEMGADAIRAVEVANKFSVHCGLGVQSYKIGE